MVFSPVSRSALSSASNTASSRVSKEQLASSLAGLLRLANDLGISLEDAYLAKVRENIAMGQRTDGKST